MDLFNKIEVAGAECEYRDVASNRCGDPASIYPIHGSVQMGTAGVVSASAYIACDKHAGNITNR